MVDRKDYRSNLSPKSSSHSMGVESSDAGSVDRNMRVNGGPRRLGTSAGSDAPHDADGAMPPFASSQLRTCLHSSTRWFQLVMFGVFAAAVVLAMTSKYENLSPGVIWGAVLSLCSVVFVILSYISVPSYRQHPNPLMFWRTIADALFVIQLLAQQFVRCLYYDCKPLCNNKNTQCGCSYDENAGPTCDIFAGLFEFTLIAAEAWFLCMTLNLLLSLTNPFTDFKRNTRLFHIFSWGLGLFLGLLLMNTADWAGYSDLGVCWTNALKDLPADPKESCRVGALVIDNFSEDYKAVNANITSWGFFYVWMALILICGISVWLWAWKRLSEGMPETYAIRVQSINRARFNVLAVTFYWLIVGAIYIKFLSRDRSKPSRSSELLNFVIAGKGYVDLVIWFALNDFRVEHFTRWWRSEGEDADIDLSPQVNAALRREVLFYTTSGIVQAVQAAERLPASQRIQHLALLPQSKTGASSRHLQAQPVQPPLASFARQQSEDAPFDESQRVAKNAERTKTFHDYEPHAFKKIRERFGVTNDAYIRSLSATAKERLSEGASGAFMFFSADGGLIVKSTSKEECTFLRSIAQQYADYLCDHPNSLLTRFYGCHCLELYGKQFSFVVMANLFDTDQVIHSRFDIKGSWVNRHADLPKRGKKVTCRHCNRKYIYHNSAPENSNCPSRLGGHEPNVVLKDSDLTQKLKLDRQSALELYQQLCADSDVLCSFGIMDYSLLMGINEVEYVVDEGTEENNLPSPVNINVAEAAYNPFNERSMMDPRGAGISSNGGAPASNASGVPSANKRHHFSVSSNPDQQNNRGRKVSRQPEGGHRNERVASNASVSSSGRRLPRSGMRLANTVVGPAYYHLGIIDILQTWTLQKRLERFFKIAFKGVDGDGLSAIPPKLYKKRFQLKMADILGVEDVVSDDHMDIFTQQNSHMDVDTTRVQLSHVQSIRALPSLDHHHLSSMDSHYDRTSKTLRQRSLDRSQSSQSVGQDTEEYSGIDYHL
ncbi:hypothetical protein Poli38472_014365 [Pythium oligandrum]|uniref:Uncharacterized protein n=1 Tax=Pythium oligandrum TaxID=41045 RepID=A0A8K1C858_PYTOL|nr:hypothetical protein Poli38472_014365 [Pythium oligandrum]|eukprot:TMW57762.1 hypothetical protein Poli38472_014365 [Pythium oligandrum]